MYNLMIVDDEEHVRNGITDTYNWSDLGFRVCATAENGRKALKLIESERPHAVLTDIVMPDMDGLHLTEQLRRTYPDITVILLSAHDEFKYAKLAIEYGVRSYLLKPIDDDELKAVFHSVRTELRQGEGGLRGRRPGPMEKPFAASLPTSEPDSYIARAKSFVHEAYSRKITLEEVAGQLYLTPAYFSVKFKKETGQSFVDFVTEVRMDKARELLMQSDYKVKEIAVRIGYDDYTYFCKTFRKVVGATPLEYRSKHMR